MATVSSIINQALTEIGVLPQGVTASSADLATALTYVQNMVDAWQADNLTLAVMPQVAVTWPSSTSTQTIGPTGANITAQRPVWINELNYVVPGTNPEVEVPLGPMDRDQYAVQSIKNLSSAYPLTFFYQTSLTQTYGTLFLWPQPSQSLKLYLYYPTGVTVPTSTSDALIGPPGYQEAFVYQLALRLCNPWGRNPPPLLPGLAANAYAAMKRPNMKPGLLGIDPALAPATGGAYNVLSDVFSGWYGGGGR